MAALYNEIDPYAADWLENLILCGLIADGHVDRRDIRDLRPCDLAGYDQVHLFAGIGGWPLALRMAGVADTARVWTGSCPCQPFSAAGKGGGFDDERHLWPATHWLIDQCRPPVFFGEQVASKDGLNWLDLVQADMEGSGYAFAANDLCAAGIGAPHIRQRLYFAGALDHAADARHDNARQHDGGSSPFAARSVESGSACFVADANDEGPQGRRQRGDGADQRPVGASGVAGWMANADGRHASAEWEQRSGQHGQQPQDGGAGGLADTAGERRKRLDALLRQEAGGRITAADLPEVTGCGPTNGVWRDADWLCCRDGKWRPVEPGTFPLAHGVPARVGRLRAYGNAIVPPLAAEFISACYDQAN